MLIFLDDTEVFGDRLVQPGDTVELVPVELMEWEKSYGQCKKTLFYDFMTRWLGEPPYKVERIGIWPCGQTILYLRGSKRDIVAYASHFM